MKSAIDLIESVAGSRVLFVGDSIVDDYHYVKALGKSPKEHILVVESYDRETFTGGVEAASRHAQSFCHVDVCTTRESVVKTRFVDKLYMRKLFEVHDNDRITTIDELPTNDYDAVIVTDFGHGAICQAQIEELIKRPFLAVNAQTNSSNVGYNLITKYPRADYIVIDEPEARLAAQDRYGDIERVILWITEKMNCQKMIVTCGSEGAIGYDGSFSRVDALTTKVVDTMGAGDAFFAVTAPMARHGAMKDLLTIGNAAGAMKTQIVGHRESITKRALLEYLRAS